MPWEANHEAFAGYRKAVAAGMGVSVSLVDKYCAEPKPTGDGEYSPLERVIEGVRALRAAGARTAEVQVQYLLKELGYTPGVRFDEVGEPASLTSAGVLMKEVGEYLGEHGQLVADGEMSLVDAIRIEAQLTDVARVVERERCALLTFIARAEDQQTRLRIGPKRAPRFIESRRAATA
jgi:hypothetical protein